MRLVWSINYDNLKVRNKLIQISHWHMLQQNLNSLEVAYFWLHFEKYRRLKILEKNKSKSSIVRFSSDISRPEISQIARDFWVKNIEVENVGFESKISKLKMSVASSRFDWVPGMSSKCLRTSLAKWTLVKVESIESARKWRLRFLLILRTHKPKWFLLEAHSKR